jgi:hypothetical protein
MGRFAHLVMLQRRDTGASIWIALDEKAYRHIYPEDGAAKSLPLDVIEVIDSALHHSIMETSPFHRAEILCIYDQCEIGFQNKGVAVRVANARPASDTSPRRSITLWTPMPLPSSSVAPGLFFTIFMHTALYVNRQSAWQHIDEFCMLRDSGSWELRCRARGTLIA